MKLIDPITGGIVETLTDEATKRFTARGYKPYLPPTKSEQPKKTARRRTTKKAD